MRDIGKNIKQLRSQKKMTQDELAEKLFVTRQTVSNYETGKSRPDVEMLVKIAEVLHTDIHQLIYGPEPSIEASKKRLLLGGIAATVLFAVLYLLIQQADEAWHSRYLVSLGLFNRALVLPLLLLAAGWTVAHLTGMALRREPLQFTWTAYARKVLVIVLALALVLSIWCFGAVVLNDWLYAHKVRGEWREIEVTNTLDGSTYMSQSWTSLPPPIPNWLQWLGWSILLPPAVKCIWLYPLLGAALWLLGFPKNKK